LYSLRIPHPKLVSPHTRTEPSAATWCARQAESAQVLSLDHCSNCAIVVSGAVEVLRSTADHVRCSFLDSRVTDGVIRRMIDKWLKAGVLEDELLRHATEGSPQALAAVTDWCRTHRHLSIPEQHAQLVAKMRGHYAYYGISGNFRRLSCP